MKKETYLRQSNIELLRVICMMLILMSHTDDWTGLATLYSSNICINRFIVDWLNMGGQIGVGGFILITGYFSLDSKFSIRKILLLWGEVLTYTVGFWMLYALMSIHEGNEINVGRTLCAFFPITFSHYWFMTAYFILMILSPFITIFINALDKERYRMFLLIIIVFVGISGLEIVDMGFPNFFIGMWSGRLIPVQVLFFIAGYIKRFYDDNQGWKRHLKKALIGYLMIYISIVTMELLGLFLENEKYIANSNIFRPLSSPLVIFVAVELFMAFKNMNIKYSKVINRVAKSTLGVYLIHSNDIVRDFLLPRVFPLYLIVEPCRLFFSILVTLIIVYFVCIIIDIMRDKSIGVLYSKLLTLLIRQH